MPNYSAHDAQLLKDLRHEKNHEKALIVIQHLESFEAIREAAAIALGREPVTKPLNVTSAEDAKAKSPTIEFWGDGDQWKLLGKASDQVGGWMKSTKAMQIPGVGCLVQVTTESRGRPAEAVTFVPGVMIQEVMLHGKVISRSLIKG